MIEFQRTGICNMKSVDEIEYFVSAFILSKKCEIIDYFAESFAVKPINVCHGKP